MAKTFVIDSILVPEQLACRISERFLEWDTFRDKRLNDWKEIQQHIFATDTSQTSNSKLPWSNKTTVPKLCQIRDNLYANYMATLFPKRKWMTWVSDSEADDATDKRRSIEAYMGWVVDRNEFYDEVSKLVLDYIDYGNCFVMPDWVDRRHTIETENRGQVGYAGPVLRRIGPLDIVFNPAAPSFIESPKIIRSLVSLGEIKEMLIRGSNTPEEREAAEALFAYMKDIRSSVKDVGRSTVKDAIYNVAGFGDFKSYLECDTVEVLTFYGDIYDSDRDEYLRNHVIKIVDRHKILSKKPNASYFGTAPIYHAGWRIRPDNLWAMGPLENLVGMQYRIDHLENMKADVFDLIAYPPLKVKGYVEDFVWGPFERINVGDDGDVELLSPDVQALQADTQIAILEQKMEEMSGSPKEAMGFRSPGEKTAYEVQRIENAASRIFQNKTAQFERGIVEQALNAMLELAKRMSPVTEIRIFDEENKIDVFKTVTPEDISGAGRIKPIAARNFAEKATMVQNLSNFYGSAAGQDAEVAMHFSSVRLAQMWEQILDIEPFDIVQPYVRLSERTDAQRLMQVGQENTLVEAQTASGIGNDFDIPGQ